MSSNLKRAIRNGYVLRNRDILLRLAPLAALSYLIYAPLAIHLFRWTDWQTIGCILVALFVPLATPGLVENVYGLIAPEKSSVGRRLASKRDPLVDMKTIEVRRIGSEEVLRLELELQFKSKKHFRLAIAPGPLEVEGPYTRKAQQRLDHLKRELRRRQALINLVGYA
jgi:hypothetical protein